ncbi:DUF892 family protein [Paracidobacterium acidisoli]|uniref:DUF892 family protein n=1 Tax=Paracidobacterium acidisoli TaxID=2303751 RepID=A0A372IK78_9BACT|nr:DUF892 family protein [Paracidobacterium acidisoli]MBT9333067.1 DUF892 family protein [Paracidobacterium acidisoli]
MAETVQERINRYLEDAVAAERNFDSTLHAFAHTGVQHPAKVLFASLAGRTRTQHERLTALLKKRGGAPSAAKTALAHTLAFTPLCAQMGQGHAEKNTQNLIITFAAAAAEMAMYESLAVAAAEAGDEETAALAQTLQSEEHSDSRQIWNLLRHSAKQSFEDEVSSGKEPEHLIRDYLEEAIAAEISFEKQLRAFSKDADDAAVQQLFAQHAQETHAQHEILVRKLRTFKATPSVLKDMLAHLFVMTPKVAQSGHDGAERLSQNLMMAYAAENAEVAMYEALAEASLAAGTPDVERMALSIQQQEKEAAEKIWNQLAPAARRAVSSMATARAS